MSYVIDWSKEFSYRSGGSSDPEAIKKVVDDYLDTTPISNISDGIVTEEKLGTEVKKTLNDASEDINNVLKDAPEDLDTFKEVDEALGKIREDFGKLYKIKGSVESREDLPSDPEVGDVYDIQNEGGMNVVWTGTEWDNLGQLVDFSKYATKEELPKSLTDLVDDSGFIDGSVIAVPYSDSSPYYEGDYVYFNHAKSDLLGVMVLNADKSINEMNTKSNISKKISELDYAYKESDRIQVILNDKNELWAYLEARKDILTPDPKPYSEFIIDSYEKSHPEAKNIPDSELDSRILEVKEEIIPLESEQKIQKKLIAANKAFDIGDHEKYSDPTEVNRLIGVIYSLVVDSYNNIGDKKIYRCIKDCWHVSPLDTEHWVEVNITDELERVREESSASIHSLTELVNDLRDKLVYTIDRDENGIYIQFDSDEQIIYIDNDEPSPVRMAVQDVPQELYFSDVVDERDLKEHTYSFEIN